MQDDRRVETDWAGLWLELCEVSRQRRLRRMGRTWTGRSQRHPPGPGAGPSRIRPARRLRPCWRLHPARRCWTSKAGTGAWAAYFAPFVARITAVEPSPAMLDVLQETLADQDIRNVDVLQATWPDADAWRSLTSPSARMLCAAAICLRSCAAWNGWRRTCFLVLRAPSTEGVMAEAALHLWGHPYDSPNFQIAYNVLLRMGIRPNVLFEDAGCGNRGRATPFRMRWPR